MHRNMWFSRHESATLPGDDTLLNVLFTQIKWIRNAFPEVNTNVRAFKAAKERINKLRLTHIQNSQIFGRN